MDSISLRVENLSAGYYRDIPIVHEVSILAEKALVTCIIGPNGAGKSTLLKAICRLIPLIDGRIWFDFYEINSLDIKNIVALGIVYVPQDNQLFPKLSVFENLVLPAKILKMPMVVIKERLKETVDELFPSLKTNMYKAAGVLSGGQQKMIAIARGLIVDAKLFMLDEPTAGLSPALAFQIYDVIRQLRRIGKTVLLVDQNIREALHVSDFCYVMDNGRVKVSGKSNDILGSLNDIVRGWLSS